MDIKNLIISILLVVILNMIPGEWGVEGIYRALFNIVLVIVFDYCICELDRIIRYGRRYNS